MRLPRRIFSYAEGYRARRINQLLATQDNLTVEDIKKIQLDVYEVLAASIIPEMIAAVDPISSKTTVEVDALNLLRGACWARSL